jgi:hypothetical protein
MPPSKCELETDLSEVLRAFAAECPRPGSQEVCEWQERYPEHADEIMDLAFELLLESPDTDEQLVRGRIQFHEMLRRAERSTTEDV